MQPHISLEPNVCPSICQMGGLWQNERKFLRRFLFILVFRHEWLVKTDPVRAESPIFNWYSLVPKPYHLAKEVQLTLTGSPLRAFQWAYDEHHTLPLSPQRRSIITKNGHFPFKIALIWKKISYKVSVKTISIKAVRLAYQSVQKWLMGTSPSVRKFGLKLTHHLPEHQFSIDFHS